MADDIVDQLNQEDETLDSNLSEIREKFITQWTGEDMQEMVKKLQAEHKEFLSESKEQVVQHQNKAKNKQEQNVTDLKVLEDRVKKLQELKSELLRYKAETDDLLRKRENAEIELQQAQQHVKKESEGIELQSKAAKTKLEELDKSVAMFSDRLDFKFKKIPGDRLQFVFTSIDRNDPDAGFCFSLKLEGSDRKYVVSDCNPPVADLDALVEKLNATNNLKSFVVCMRKRFQKVALDSK